MLHPRYILSLYVVHFKGALNSGDAQPDPSAYPLLIQGKDYVNRGFHHNGLAVK